MKTTPALFGLSDMRLAKNSPASGLHFPSAKLPANLLLILLSCLVGLTAGCTLRIGRKEAAKPPPQPVLVEEQLQLQRFADDFLAQGAEGLDKSAERLGTEAGREQVLRIKVSLGSSVLGIVSGPNPNENLLDLVSVTVITRLSIEDYWMKTTNGTAFQPWLDVSRVLETNVWDLATRYLKPSEVTELRSAINKWYAQTPAVRTGFFVRPHAFIGMVRNTQEKETADKSGKSVFSLVGLDPFAGLDPAVREVTQSRLFAERAMYTAQRLPFMLRHQGELMAYDLTEQPNARQALTNATRFSDAATSLSQTVSRLPDQISAERKEVFAALDSQESKLRNLVADVNRALISGEKMSGSLSVTLTNAQRFVETFRGQHPSNAPLFNILDYAKTAEGVSAMAQNLNALVNSMNQSAPEIQRLTQQASAELGKQEDRSFRLGLMLIAVLLIGMVLAGLIYTFFAEKLRRRAAAGRNV